MNIASILLCACIANYQNHPHFMPYELLNEARKDELRTFSLDLLRYARFNGFEPIRGRSSLYERVVSEQGQNEKEKFSLQFLKKFLKFFEEKLDVDFYLKVLFPVLTSYLERHAGYFMPNSTMQATSTTASREEKKMIIK